MGNKVKTIEIPAEEAVFWLDANGNWHNADGKFRHKKIIDYFHASIRRDDKGYHLYQAHEHYIEKVYFNYEDTVLFVFDVLPQTEIMLVLNTKRRVRLRPRNMLVKNDSLYMHIGDEIIKFAEHGLMKIAPFLEEDGDRLFIRSKSRRYRIATLAEKENIQWV